MYADTDPDPLLDGELLAFLKDVAARNACFDEPASDFDPLKLSPKASLRLGLPRPPHRRDRAFELWHLLAASRVRTGAKLVAALLADTPTTGYNRLGLKGHLETSRNWSGGVISSPYRQRPFGFLIGVWTIPDFRRPVGTSAPDHACSTWIGFDGHRRTSRSLPQIGTVQRISKDGTRSVQAWRQWWWRGTKGPHEYEAEDFPVAVGDEIIASLFIIPKIGVLMNMLNVRTGTPIAPVLTPPPESHLEPRALDAECVLERPRPLEDSANFVVPDFDPTTFRCHAFLRGQTTSRGMRGSRLLRMVHLGPRREIETIATPIRAGDPASVTVRYRGG